MWPLREKGLPKVTRFYQSIRFVQNTLKYYITFCLTFQTLLAIFWKNASLSRNVLMADTNSTLSSCRKIDAQVTQQQFLSSMHRIHEMSLNYATKFNYSSQMRTLNGLVQNCLKTSKSYKCLRQKKTQAGIKVQNQPMHQSRIFCASYSCV